MTIREAKLSIAKEIIDNFEAWLSDVANKEIDQNSFSKKWNGYAKPLEKISNNQKSFILFLQYFYSCANYIPGWEKKGFDKKLLAELHAIGFLSLSESSSWASRQTGRTHLYYVSQSKAKEIYKAYKNGFFNK